MGSHRSVNVEVFAKNLRNPTHMEWDDDRLLLSEFSGGEVLDITEGGDAQEAEVVADGLESPASILPRDDQLLVADTLAGKIVDITEENEPFLEDLSLPYSLAEMHEEVIVSGKRSTDAGVYIAEVINASRTRELGERSILIDGIPASTGVRGNLSELNEFDQDLYPPHFLMACAWMIYIPEREAYYKSVPSLGQLIEIEDTDETWDTDEDTDEMYTYLDLINKRGTVVATGFGHTGGMKYNSEDGLIYVTEMHEGTVVSIDVDEPTDVRYDPPVIRGLDKPNCVRFGPDGEMYVCERGPGRVLKVTDFR